MSGSSPVDEINRPGGSPPQSGQITCGACNASNPTGGQFCAGCGHHLYEPCNDCTKPVLLTQAFCGNCGNDLVGALSKRKTQLEEKIAEAISKAKERDFVRAKGLLEVVAREKDHRFNDVIANAKVAQQKIDSIAEQESESASDRIAAAQEAYELGDSARVVELLANLSPNLLTDDAKQNLRMSQTRLEELQQAEKSLEEAFQKRDWATSGAILDRLMELQPDDESVAKLAIKVGKKLVSKATALREAHKYGAASNMLDCVPGNAHGPEYEQLNTLVERVLWLAQQFKGEPFSTPTLGRLAKYWVETSSGDPQGTAVLERISKKIKGPKSSPRDLFAPFMSGTRSWTGGTVGVLGYPTCVELGESKAIRASAGQFNVAIGLALQGFGEGRVTQDFSPKKKGFLSRLGRKKTERCWGLDIGSYSIKAICLEASDEEDGRPKIVECYQQLLETPLARNIPESKVDETIRAAVEDFLEQFDVEQTPVWVGFPGRELVSRFVNLPPVADKQCKLLFEKEIEQRIPLPLDEVVHVSWVADPPSDELTSLGRAAFVSAAKKQYIERYLENLNLAGLTPSGLQATPIALLNFADVEFGEELAFDAEDDDEMEIKLPTITLVDCGAEMTTVMLVTSMSCWFWSFESGGNEFTRLISRATKTTHGNAEKLKRNPASLERPEVQFEMVEKRIEEMQGRLFKLVSDVATDHEEFDLQQTWCCGGGSLTHGWIKRVLCDKR